MVATYFNAKMFVFKTGFRTCREIGTSEEWRQKEEKKIRSNLFSESYIYPVL